MEAIDVVTKLNDKLYDVIPDPNDMFEFVTNGFMGQHITYAGVVLWSYEEDEREFFEDKNDYEDLYQFCIKQLWKYLNELNKVANAFNED